jgi:hypothetical protein
LAHEALHGQSDPGSEAVFPTSVALEPNHDRVLIRVYEADDGFRGTYDEVVAHEKTLGMATNVAWHEPLAVQQHVASLHAALATHQAEAKQHRVEVARYLAEVAELRVELGAL